MNIEKMITLLAKDRKKKEKALLIIQVSKSLFFYFGLMF